MYGFKIQRALKGNDKGEGAVALRRIRRFIWVILIISIPTFGVRCWGLVSISTVSELQMQYRNQVTPCVNEPFWWFFIIFWALAYGGLYLIHPVNKKKGTIMNQVKETLLSRMSNSSKVQPSMTSGASAVSAFSTVDDVVEEGEAGK